MHPMIVCVCNAVSDADIRRQAQRGVRDFPTLQRVTGCATCCGCCEQTARTVLVQAVKTHGAMPVDRVRELPWVPVAA